MPVLDGKLEAPGEISDERAAGAIIQILTDPDSDVLDYAVEALRKLRAPAVQILTHASQKSKDKKIRQAAKRVLEVLVPKT